MTPLKKLEIYRQDAKDAKKFKVELNILCKIVRTGKVLTLLFKNLCALCVLAVKETFFQESLIIDCLDWEGSLEVTAQPVILSAAKNLDWGEMRPLRCAQGDGKRVLTCLG